MQLLCSTLALVTLVSLHVPPPQEPEPGDPVIPVTVTARADSDVIPAGRPIPLSITISNGLRGAIGYSAYSLTPNEWNGETVSLSLVDIYRDDVVRGLYLARPEVDPPREITGMSGRRIEPDQSLTIQADASKWKIVDGWIPGRYRVVLRVENLTADGNRCILSVHSAPFEFEIR